MNEAEKLKMPVTIWTADNPLWVKRAQNLGIAAIITNNPARLLAKTLFYGFGLKFNFQIPNILLESFHLFPFRVSNQNIVCVYMIFR
jgi:hypothetical protein